MLNFPYPAPDGPQGRNNLDVLLFNNRSFSMLKQPICNNDRGIVTRGKTNDDIPFLSLLAF